MASGTHHVQPHTSDQWHHSFPGEKGMERRMLQPARAQQGNDISTLAKVVGRVRRDHCHVFLGGLDPGQAPLKTLLLLLRLT